MKERKLRIEDALTATRAAVEEGIVPGGGSGPDRGRASRVAKLMRDVHRRRQDRRAASSCARWKSLLRQIAVNAGVEGSVIVEKINAASKRLATATTPPRTSTPT